MASISNQQIINASKIVGCEPASIAACYDVETAGSGFLPDGRLKILFEAHIFWDQLSKGKFNPAEILKQNPGFSNILCEKHTRKYYVGGSGEWERFSQALVLAKKINAPAITVMNSASYGSFQIMGFNAILAGYSDAQQMITAFNNGGEYECLQAFCRYVKSSKLDDELRAKDWAEFAKKYNGPGYKGNPTTGADDYDLKLEKAYKKNLPLFS